MHTQNCRCRKRKDLNYLGVVLTDAGGLDRALKWFQSGGPGCRLRRLDFLHADRSCRAPQALEP